jgi:hypothetical protein
MPNKGINKYDDEEHIKKREYMTQYRTRLKNSYIHFKRKTGLRSRDCKDFEDINDRVAYLKLIDHFANKEDVIGFMIKYNPLFHHMLDNLNQQDTILTEVN